MRYSNLLSLISSSLLPTSPESFNSALSTQELLGAYSEGIKCIIIRASHQKGVATILRLVTNESGDASLKVYGRWSAESGLSFMTPLWQQSYDYLRGRLIRIIKLEKPSVFVTDGTQTVEGTAGYTAEMVKIFQKKFQFQAVFIHASEFGNKKSNGTVTGMVGALVRNEADFSPLDFNPTPSRREVVEFSSPIGIDAVLVLSQAPRSVPRPFILLEVFSPVVWVCIVLTAVVAGIMLFITSYVKTVIDERSTTVSFLLPIIVCLKLMIYQSSDNGWPRNTSGRLFAVFVMFVALIVFALYQGTITAFLAIPVRVKPIDNVHDVLSSGLKIAVRFGTSFHGFLLTDPPGIYKEVTPIMEEYPESALLQWSFLKRVAAGEYVLFDTRSSAVGRSRRFERRGTRCMFYISRDHVFTNFDALAFQRNSPIIEPFDEVIEWMMYYGIVAKLKERASEMPCQPEFREGEPVSLQLVQVQGALYILALGLISCCVTFLGEIIYGKLIRR